MLDRLAQNGSPLVVLIVGIPVLFFYGAYIAFKILIVLLAWVVSVFGDLIFWLTGGEKGKAKREEKVYQKKRMEKWGNTPIPYTAEELDAMAEKSVKTQPLFTAYGKSKVAKW